MITALATLLLAFTAFTVIASAMDRHVDDLKFVAAPEHAKKWLAGGWLLLAVSLLPCLLRWNPSVALAAWFGLLTFAALSLGLLLTYIQPLALRRIAPAAGAVGTLLAGVAVF